MQNMPSAWAVLRIRNLKLEICSEVLYKTQVPKHSSTHTPKHPNTQTQQYLTHEKTDWLRGVTFSCLEDDTSTLQNP
jgi:hypothetical protein